MLVGIGGFVGAVARFGLSGFVLRHTVNSKFPLNTFLINVLGCLVAGLIFGWSEKYSMLSSNARLFIFTGVLGGFTTFSAFGLETFALLQRRELATALLYIVSSVLVGISALWLGVNFGSD